MENSHQRTSQIKVISECFIKPKHEIEPSKQPYYLAPADLFFLSLDPMQKGLLFHEKPKNILNFLDKFRNSLSLSLVHFFPLAGKLVTQKFHDEHASWVYVDCINGKGARLIHASIELRLADLLSSVDVNPIVPSFFDLGERTVNHDGHTRPLLSVQVTELIDGVFIGFTMNHSVADGTSLWHFISTLSEVFLQLKDGDQDKSFTPDESISDSSMNVKISRKPIYKPFFPEGYGPILKLPYLEPEEFVARFDPERLRERIFHFTPKAISTLKAKVNKECSIHNNISISSFQALSAFLWRSITRARNLQPEFETNCSLAINWRARVSPTFSEDCFGNYLAGAQGTCKVGELLGRDLGWAALLVHQSVKAKNEGEIREFINNWAKAPFVAQTGTTSAHYKPNSVLIAGSARFDMYGPEFGLGKAVAILAGYANKDDGKVTANPGREGGGSLDLEVCLKPHVMERLEFDEEFMSFAS